MFTSTREKLDEAVREFLTTTSGKSMGAAADKGQGACEKISDWLFHELARLSLFAWGKGPRPPHC